MGQTGGDGRDHRPAVFLGRCVMPALWPSPASRGREIWPGRRNKARQPNQGTSIDVRSVCRFWTWRHVRQALHDRSIASGTRGQEHNQKSGQLTCYLNRTSIGAVNTQPVTTVARPRPATVPSERVVTLSQARSLRCSTVSEGDCQKPANHRSIPDLHHGSAKLGVRPAEDGSPVRNVSAHMESTCNRFGRTARIGRQAGWCTAPD